MAFLWLVCLWAALGLVAGGIKCVAADRDAMALSPLEQRIKEGLCAFRAILWAGGWCAAAALEPLPAGCGEIGIWISDWLAHGSRLVAASAWLQQQHLSEQPANGGARAAEACGNGLLREA